MKQVELIEWMKNVGDCWEKVSAAVESMLFESGVAREQAEYLKELATNLPAGWWGGASEASETACDVPHDQEEDSDCDWVRKYLDRA